jgi:hypothetical protein
VKIIPHCGIRPIVTGDFSEEKVYVSPVFGPSMNRILRVFYYAFTSITESAKDIVAVCVMR